MPVLNLEKPGRFKKGGIAMKKPVAKKKGGMAFKTCRGCPTPAKCKAAGKCLKEVVIIWEDDPTWWGSAITKH
jgi:hypothetical protein